MARFSDDESSRESSLVFGECDGIDTNRKRNLDRRRETSRYAARDRRGKEADIFSDLKDVVPIVEESTVTHVDRIALLRVASTMCRMRRNAGKFLETELPQEDPQVHCFTEQNMTECLDGFVLLADSDGTILYVSESVSIFLGLTQTDLVGRFLKEFVHSNDYDELIRASTTSTEVQDTASSLDEFGRYIVVRMKTVISPRGRNLNLKSALFKAILCRFRAVNTEYGRLSLLYGSSTPAGQGNSIMLANASVKGSEATNGVYMTRHTCDMRFSYVSDSLNYLLRHDARSLMGTSFYDIVHPSDMIPVAESMKELFLKGHCRTPFYRLLGSNNSVAWVQTEATTVNHTARGQKGQYVLCVHSVVGMQSELDAWSEPVVDGQMAAHPAVCVSKIKHEIPDMAEYMGKQPEFVDCVDFTPLIEPIIDINYDDYSSMNGMRGHEKRKKSFDEVLDWLVRDEADSPPPYASFFDQADECRADPTSSSDYDGRTFRQQQFGGYQQTQFERMPYNNEQRPGSNGLGPSPAASLAPRNRVERGAPSTAGTIDGIGRPVASLYAPDGQVYSSMQRGSTRVQQPHGNKSEPRHSRFSAHMRREIGVGQPNNMLRQGQPSASSARGAAAVRARSASSRAVSAASTPDVYLMSGAQLGSAARRFPPGAPVHSTMRAACDPQSPAYTRASSTSSTRSTFDSAAARRYAQASPAPRQSSQSGRSRCSSTCSGFGGTPKPREQRPVNVNQLPAVTTAVVHPLDSPPQCYQEPYNSYEFSDGPVCKKAAFGAEKPIYKDEYGRDFAGLAPFVPEEDFLQLEDLDLKGVFPDVDFSEFFPSDQSSNPGSAGSLPMMEQQKQTPPCFDDVYQQPMNVRQHQESIVPDNWRITENELW